MTKALVPITDGTEEMEAVIVIDMLRRAGVDVTSVSPNDRTVTCSRSVKLVADALWPDIDPATFDMLVIPGGMPGTTSFCAFQPLLDTIRIFNDDSKIIGAICAGPLVLQAAGILTGRHVTCNPGIAEQLTSPSLSCDRVVIDANIVTSQGPGTSFEFASAIIRMACGEDAAEQAVAAALALNC